MFLLTDVIYTHHCPESGGGGNCIAVFLWKNDSVSNVMARIVGIQDMSLLAIAASDVS